MKKINYVLSLSLSLMFTGCGGCGSSNNQLGISIKGAAGVGLVNVVSGHGLEANEVSINSVGSANNNFFVLYPDGHVDGTTQKFVSNGQEQEAKMEVTEVHASTDGIFLFANVVNSGWYFVSNTDEEVLIAALDTRQLSYVYSTGTKLYLMDIAGAVFEWDTNVRELKQIMTTDLNNGVSPSSNSNQYFIVGRAGSLDPSNLCTSQTLFYSIATGQTIKVNKCLVNIAPIDANTAYVIELGSTTGELLNINTSVTSGLTYGGAAFTTTLFNGYSIAPAIVSDGAVFSSTQCPGGAILCKVKGDGTVHKISDFAFAPKAGTYSLKSNSSWLVIEEASAIRYLPSSVSVNSINMDSMEEVEVLDMVRANSLTDPVTILSGYTITATQIKGDLLYYSATDTSGNPVSGYYNMATGADKRFNSTVAFNKMAAIQ